MDLVSGAQLTTKWCAAEPGPTLNRAIADGAQHGKAPLTPDLRRTAARCAPAGSAGAARPGSAASALGELEGTAGFGAAVFLALDSAAVTGQEPALLEKGAQLGFVAQGVLLVVSGVYYPVSVLPEWMQAIAKISPATYALRGCRAAILEGAGITALWADIWPLLVIGAVSVPLGLWVFHTGEQYAKKHGKLKRSG